MGGSGRSRLRRGRSCSVHKKTNGWFLVSLVLVSSSLQPLPLHISPRITLPASMPTTIFSSRLWQAAPAMIRHVPTLAELDEVPKAVPSQGLYLGW